MGLIIGVVPHCLNCGADISKETFPHYCGFCIESIRKTGQLPSGLLEQDRLGADDVSDLPVLSFFPELSECQ
jgi:hypothetical protein